MDWIVKKVLAPTFSNMFEDFDQTAFELKFLRGKTELHNLRLRKQFLRKVLFGWAPPGGNLAAKLGRLTDDASAVIDTLSVECYKGTIIHVRSHPVRIKIGTVRIEMIDTTPSKPSSDSSREPNGTANAAPHPTPSSPHASEPGGDEQPDLPKTEVRYVYVDCTDCGGCLRAAALGDGVLCPCGTITSTSPDTTARIRPEVSVGCPQCGVTLQTPLPIPEIVCFACQASFEVTADSTPQARLIRQHSKPKGAASESGKRLASEPSKPSSFMGLGRDCSDAFAVDINKVEIVVTTIGHTPNVLQSDQKVSIEVWLEDVTSRRTDHTWTECTSLNNAKRAERARKLGTPAKGMHCIYRQIDVRECSVFVRSPTILESAAISQTSKTAEGGRTVELLSSLPLRFRLKSRRTDKVSLDSVKDVEWTGEVLGDMSVHLADEVLGAVTIWLQRLRATIHLIQSELLSNPAQPKPGFHHIPRPRSFLNLQVPRVTVSLNSLPSGVPEFVLEIQRLRLRMSKFPRLLAQPKRRYRNLSGPVCDQRQREIGKSQLKIVFEASADEIRATDGLTNSILLTSCEDPDVFTRSCYECPRDLPFIPESIFSAEGVQSAWGNDVPGPTLWPLGDPSRRVLLRAYHFNERSDLWDYELCCPPVCCQSVSRIRRRLHSIFSAALANYYPPLKIVGNRTTPLDTVVRQLVVLPTAILLSSRANESGMQPASGEPIFSQRQATKSPMVKVALGLSHLCANPEGDFEVVDRKDVCLRHEVILEGIFRTVGGLLQWKGSRRFIQLAQGVTDKMDVETSCELLCYTERPTNLGSAPRLKIPICRATGVGTSKGKLIILQKKERFEFVEEEAGCAAAFEAAVKAILRVKPKEDSHRLGGPPAVTEKSSRLVVLPTGGMVQLSFDKSESLNIDLLVANLEVFQSDSESSVETSLFQAERVSGRLGPLPGKPKLCLKLSDFALPFKSSDAHQPALDKWTDSVC